MGTRLTLSATPGRNYGSFVRIVILLIPSRMFTATARKRTYTAESRLRAYTATARKRTYTAESRLRAYTATARKRTYTATR